MKKFFLLLAAFLCVQNALIFSLDKPQAKTSLLLPGKQLNAEHDQITELSTCLETWAIQQFSSMDQSIYFDKDFIVDTPRVKKRHFGCDNDKKNKGEKVTVETIDEVKIECTYFNRNSDKLLIVGEGFTNDREKMTPFLTTFDSYDIVLFDFRGQGYQETTMLSPELFGTTLVTYLLLQACSQNGHVNDAKLDQQNVFTSPTAKKLAISAGVGVFASLFGLNPFNWSGRLSQMTFGMNSRLVSFGKNEEKDVVAVVQEFKERKEKKNGESYKHVYGLGVCYGAFVLPKVEALYPKTFDKLILDGCWRDLPSVVNKIRNDLKMTCNPQRGGWSRAWPLSRPWCQKSIEFLARHVWGIDFGTKNSLDDFIGGVTETPILYFHGKDDLMVPFDEFTDIWNKTVTPYKAAIITSNEHVINHLKQKQLYKVISELFFDYDYPTFIAMMQQLDGNMKTIKHHFESKLHGE